MELSYRADGEANQYTILLNGKWLAAVQLNGELPVGQQTAIMGVFVSSLGEAIKQQASKSALPTPEPSNEYDEEWDSYDGWAAEGYHVRRGEKSRKRINGVPVFSADQVDEDELDFERDWP